MAKQQQANRLQDRYIVMGFWSSSGNPYYLEVVLCMVAWNIVGHQNFSDPRIAVSELAYGMQRIIEMLIS